MEKRFSNESTLLKEGDRHRNDQRAAAKRGMRKLLTTCACHVSAERSPRTRCSVLVAYIWAMHCATKRSTKKKGNKPIVCALPLRSEMFDLVVQLCAGCSGQIGEGMMEFAHRNRKNEFNCANNDVSFSFDSNDENLWKEKKGDFGLRVTSGSLVWWLCHPSVTSGSLV